MSRSDRRVMVRNKAGLHARPAAMIVKLVAGFSSDIEIENLACGAEANAKFLLEVMQLNAPCATELEVRGSGDDADEAVAAICNLIERGFEED